MTSEIVKDKLEELKKRKSFDSSFIDVLINSDKSDIDGPTTARAILDLIEERYAESKKNKAKRVPGDTKSPGA